LRLPDCPLPEVQFSIDQVSIAVHDLAATTVPAWLQCSTPRRKVFVFGIAARYAAVSVGENQRRSAITSAAENAVERKPGAAPRWLRLAPFVFLVLWCSGFGFIKIGLSRSEPMTFLAIRHGLALLVLLAIAAVIRPRWPRRAAQWGHLVAVGVLIQFVYFGLCYIAVARGVSPGTLALIVALQPVLVGIVAPGLVGERVTVARWVGLGLGLAGAVVVIVARSAVAAPPTLGLLAAVGGLLGITIGSLYEKRFGTAQHPVTANAVQYAAGLAVSAPLALAFEHGTIAWSGEFVVALAYLVLANSLVSTTLLLIMIRHGEVSRVSALFFLVPPGAALAAWLIVGETMPPIAWAGMALAACGVAVASARPLPTGRR
jgi:drug/metabolite transporter (DMT)-like permease